MGWETVAGRAFLATERRNGVGDVGDGSLEALKYTRGSFIAEFDTVFLYCNHLVYIAVLRLPNVNLILSISGIRSRTRESMRTKFSLQKVAESASYEQSAERT